MLVGGRPVVETKKERCRMCYTCIRECPAKAIRVAGAQASVDPERCIGCGNCVRVCSQNAKQVCSMIDETIDVLRSGRKVAAIIAPSFPAEFSDMKAEELVGVLKTIGFCDVFEVAFGADLVAREYKRILDESTGRYIGSTCPAIVSYIEKYAPDLVEYLIPVVSPMIATARVVRAKYDPDTAIVFIGPCIAKKGEACDSAVSGEVDVVLTFRELRVLIGLLAPDTSELEPKPFAEPRGRLGGVFATTRGLLQTASLLEDIVKGDIVAAEGNPRFVSAVREFRQDDGTVRFLELLSCEGCIMGVGFSRDEPLLARRRRISAYVQSSLNEHSALAPIPKEFDSIPLHRTFESRDRRICEPTEDEIEKALLGMDKRCLADELNCGACGYPTCRHHAAAVCRGLAEPEMCLPYTIEHLREAVHQLEDSNGELVRTKEALIQSEKLASMGQMAAGIAHEINNPLGIVLLYANLLLESYQENPTTSEDVKIIVEQTNRCRKIVTGLLNFARQNKVFRQETDIIKLCIDAVVAANISANINTSVKDGFVGLSGTASIDPDQIHQVLANLIQNACAAMHGGGNLTIYVDGTEDSISISIQDTGSGIPEEHLSKIFEPFFSTKPVGKGTGLGLAVVHGIVKMHQGRIQVTSNANPECGPTGSTFVVTLPRQEL